MKLAAQAPRTTSNPGAEAERRRAFRALLRNPLLPAAGETAEKYALVRRHSEWLKQWLAKFPDWTLHIDGQVARLRKIPADLHDETRPAIDRSSGTTFTKRRYALLCLALAALEQMELQTTLGPLAQAIMDLAADDHALQEAGLYFDAGNYDHRRDLIHAVRFLVDVGVLRKLDGDEQQFQNRTDRPDARYDINRHILAAILHVSQNASAFETDGRRSRQSGRESYTERAARLCDRPIPATEEGRAQSIRSRLIRALLDDPVLYFRDLNEEERNYLEKHRGYLLREICDATGLIAEVRREGIAMVDDAGDLTDIGLPDPGIVGRLSWLLVQWFAECAQKSPGAAIPVSAVEERVRLMHDRVIEGRLTEYALLRLRALRLIQWTAAGIVPLAASGRFAAAE